MIELVKKNKEDIAMIGEFGLDYDRLKFCDKETQIDSFKKQFKIVEEFKLPRKK